MRGCGGFSHFGCCDPGSDIGRVCAFESQQYLRNQLLRDTDWAGMAHGIEIRTPLVDAALLKSLAPCIATLRPGAGKMALANAPGIPLPDEIVSRAKSGFGIPTGHWMVSAATIGAAGAGATNKGVISRRWSRFILGEQIPGGQLLAATAATL